MAHVFSAEESGGRIAVISRELVELAPELDDDAAEHGAVDDGERALVVDVRCRIPTSGSPALPSSCTSSDVKTPHTRRGNTKNLQRDMSAFL